MRIDGRIAIVTGAGCGIGAAIARRFAAAGAQVIAAAAALFLACDEASVVNGAVIPVDGAASARMAAIEVPK